MSRPKVGKKASEFHDRNEPRKRLAYYLSDSARAILYAKVHDSGDRRRIVVINALEAMLASSITPHDIKESLSVENNVKFLYDEIPSDLWDRVDKFCRDESDRRVIKIYHAVETALVTEFEQWK